MPINITVSGRYTTDGRGAAVKRIGPASANWHLTRGHDGWKVVSDSGEQPLTAHEDLIRAISDVLDGARRTGLHVTYQTGLRPQDHEWWPATHLPVVRTGD